MKCLIVLGMLSTLSLSAATIAVIDSGVDVEHRDLLNNIWTNPLDINNNNRDEDRNGYQDDFYGWNFAENNNLVIDRKYIGTFSDDPKKFFEIQGRSFLGQATENDKKWLNEKRADEAFRKEMGIFGNFVHGTHVAGITQHNNPNAKILSVKLIPTEVKPFGKKQERVSFLNKNKPVSFRMKLLKKALKALGKAQVTQLEEIAHYVGSHNADIANGSFGTGFNQAKMITDNIFKVFFFRKPTEKESNEASKFFLNALIEAGQAISKAAPNTLFVFAAGNDGSNNDIYPTSPTNIKADNFISVAATYKYEFIAPFSNYGTKMVDLAAPGMLINSQIPGDDYLPVSGTSQAAPYVARVAALIKDENTNLTPKEIKEILMKTVDKKSFLSLKVKSSGIVNLNRAVYAAKMSLEMTLSDAISAAKDKVRNVRSRNIQKSKVRLNAKSVTPIPLMRMFK